MLQKNQALLVCFVCCAFMQRVEEQTQFYGVYERFQLGDYHWRIKSVQKFNPKACVPENILSWSGMEIQCLK